MQNILGKIVLMSAVVASTVAANAATTEKRFEVPFSFTVSGQTWPAGTYLLEKGMINDNVVLQSKDAGRSLVMTLGPGDPAPGDTRALLTFAEDQQNHELKAVQFGSATASLHHKHNNRSEQLPVRMVQGQ